MSKVIFLSKNLPNNLILFSLVIKTQLFSLVIKTQKFGYILKNLGGLDQISNSKVQKFKSSKVQKFKSSNIKNQSKIKIGNFQFGILKCFHFQKMGIFKMSNNLSIGFQIWDVSFFFFKI